MYLVDLIELIKEDDKNAMKSCGGERHTHPQICVPFNGHKRFWFPEELLGIMIRHMKRRTEATFRSLIDSVVITLPAYFSSLQKDTLCNACKIAGLHVLGVIHNSEALVRSNISQYKENEKILLLDIGRYGCEICIMKTIRNQPEVLSSSVDHLICGDTFNERLIEYFAQDLSGGDSVASRTLLQDKATLSNFQQEAERAKCELSILPSSTTDNRISRHK